MKKASILVFILLSGLIINKTIVIAQQKPWKDIRDINQIIALASCEQWETIKQDEGVYLRSRWLTFGDTLKTREISLRFVINAGIQGVVTNLVTGAFIFSFNYWLGKKLLGVDSSFVISGKIDIQFASTIIKAGSDVFLSMVVGGVLTGLIAAVIVYYALMKLLVRRRY